MTEKSAPPELISALRDQVFEEVGRVAALAESYARSIGEAAYRGDATTMVVHVKQLRLCCLAMIKTYKDDMEAGREQATHPKDGPKNAG